MTTSERLTLARLLSGHGFTLPMIRSTIEVTEVGVRGLTDAEWAEVVAYLRDPSRARPEGDPLPWIVTDTERTEGGRHPVVYRSATEEGAAEWIGWQDEAKALRGGFGLDGPPEDE